LKELGIQMIPAYSPQARGRCERNFGTWQGRLPQELRLAGIQTIEQANQFLRERYIAEFNARFAVAAKQRGTAFRKTSRADLVISRSTVEKPEPMAPWESRPRREIPTFPPRRRLGTLRKGRKPKQLNRTDRV
jgi:hypothetical protein